MTNVILDTNFLFIPFQFRIDIFNELGRLFGKPKLLVLSTTMDELKKIEREDSKKNRRHASAAIELANKCTIINAKRKPKESYDNVLLRKAKELKCPVATNDITLRKKLRNEKVTVIFMRQKSYLEIY